MLKEFKEFAMKGNVAGIAVAVITGGAFGRIVTSLVNDVVMPVIGAMSGGINFTYLKYVIIPAAGETPEVAVLYGSFMQSIVDFLIIAVTMFMFVKAITSLNKKEETPEPPAEPSAEEKLLTEIRDLLAQGKVQIEDK